MPEQSTLRRARQDAHEGKSPSTQAGEFVREEMHHIREGKHGARSTKQAIAIGLSKARKSGVKLPKKRGKTRRAKARTTTKKRPSARRSRATLGALKRESRSAASPRSLSRQAKSSAKKRGTKSRHRAAMKAARTKGATGRRQAARKAARTRRKAA